MACVWYPLRLLIHENAPTKPMPCRQAEAKWGNNTTRPAGVGSTHHEKDDCERNEAEHLQHRPHHVQHLVPVPLGTDFVNVLVAAAAASEVAIARQLLHFFGALAAVVGVKLRRKRPAADTRRKAQQHQQHV